jgi:hypothetical protein
LAAGALQWRRVIDLGGGGVQYCFSLRKLVDKNEQMMERRVVAAREGNGARISQIIYRDGSAQEAV